MLQSFDPGVVALATRNPNYWEENRAHLDEVEIFAINDTTAPVSRTFDMLAAVNGINTVGSVSV